MAIFEGAGVALVTPFAAAAAFVFTAICNTVDKNKATEE